MSKILYSLLAAATILLVCVSPAFAADAPQLPASGPVGQLAYLAIAAAVIGLIVRLLKQDVTFLPTIPARWRPVVAVALGVAAGVLDKAATGVLWREAILNGVLAGFTAIAGHGVLITSARDGRELGTPKAHDAIPTPEEAPTLPVLPKDDNQ